mmetsp:Transcript_4386/g.8790  ORF Transcript_4386/g.8790 Transcript_4386/m.8790 type:complete len:131 (+) Transcript_4386:912-1304(+)
MMQHTSNEKRQSYTDSKHTYCLDCCAAAVTSAHVPLQLKKCMALVLPECSLTPTLPANVTSSSHNLRFCGSSIKQITLVGGGVSLHPSSFNLRGSPYDRALLTVGFFMPASARAPQINALHRRGLLFLLG